LVITLGYTSGPGDIWTVVDTSNYYLFGSDPTDAPDTLVLTFTVANADYEVA